MRTLARAIVVAFLAWSALAYEGAAQTPRWQLSADPIVRAGGDELNGVKGAVRLADGSLAVIQAGEVLLYGPSGRFQRYLGQKGEGPGEFGAPQSVVVLKGSGQMRVFDSLSRRITTLEVDGSVVGTQPFPPNGWFGVQSFRLLWDGSAITTDWPARSVMRMRDNRQLASGPHTDTALVVRFTASTIDTVGAWEDGVRYRVRTGNFSLDRYPPLGRQLIIAFGSNGVAVGFNDRGVFEVRSLSGAPIGTIATSLTPREISRREREAGERRFLETAAPAFTVGGRGSGWEPEVEEIVRKAPRPRDVPLIDEAVFDTEGLLWLRRATVFPDPAGWVWEVHSLGEGLKALVMIPDGLAVLEIGRDYVLGLRKDEWDVETLELHGLRRAFGPD